jgi:hypothetical protein
VWFYETQVSSDLCGLAIRCEKATYKVKCLCVCKENQLNLAQADYLRETLPSRGKLSSFFHWQIPKDNRQKEEMAYNIQMRNDEV